MNDHETNMRMRDLILLEIAQLTREPCILCKITPAGCAGVWLPEQSTREKVLEAIPCTRRNCAKLYPICSDCSGQDGSKARTIKILEDLILAVLN